MDCRPSQSPCVRGHHRRRVKPAARWLLVGTPAMALSVGAIQYEKVVPGPDAPAIQILGLDPNPACPDLALLRLLRIRLGRFLLAGCNSNALLPSHAVLRQQPAASQTRTS